MQPVASNNVFDARVTFELNLIRFLRTANNIVYFETSLKLSVYVWAGACRYNCPWFLVSFHNEFRLCSLTTQLDRKTVLLSILHSISGVFALTFYKVQRPRRVTKSGGRSRNSWQKVGIKRCMWTAYSKKWGGGQLTPWIPWIRGPW